MCITNQIWWESCSDACLLFPKNLLLWWFLQFHSFSPFFPKWHWHILLNSCRNAIIHFQCSPSFQDTQKIVTDFMTAVIPFLSAFFAGKTDRKLVFKSPPTAKGKKDRSGNWIAKNAICNQKKMRQKMLLL